MGPWSWSSKLDYSTLLPEATGHGITQPGADLFDRPCTFKSLLSNVLSYLAAMTPSARSLSSPSLIVSSVVSSRPLRHPLFAPSSSSSSSSSASSSFSSQPRLIEREKDLFKVAGGEADFLLVWFIFHGRGRHSNFLRSYNERLVDFYAMK